MSYVTLAQLNQVNFKKMVQYSPEVYESLKVKALSYEDDWIKFKIKLLQNIDYFHIHGSK